MSCRRGLRIAMVKAIRKWCNRPKAPIEFSNRWMVHCARLWMKWPLFSVCFLFLRFGVFVSSVVWQANEFCWNLFASRLLFAVCRWFCTAALNRRFVCRLSFTSSSTSSSSFAWQNDTYRPTAISNFLFAKYFQKPIGCATNLQIINTWVSHSDILQIDAWITLKWKLLEIF